MASDVVGLILGIWLLATMLNQFDRFAAKISSYDIFRLVPRWTFFAPNPGQHDIHLVIRDKYPTGVLSGWQEVLPGGNSLVIPLLWNPEKRIPKVLWDSWNSIRFAHYEYGVGTDMLPITGAYVVLLNFAMTEKASPNAMERQFSIIRSAGFQNRSLEVLFVSSFHQF